MTVRALERPNNQSDPTEILAQIRSQRISPGRNRPNTTQAGVKRFVTIDEICQDLGISRSTYYTWRACGKSPVGKKLPNGSIRIPIAVYEVWLETLEEDQ